MEKFNRKIKTIKMKCNRKQHHPNRKIQRICEADRNKHS